MPRVKLTPQLIKRLGRDEKRVEYFDEVESGLGLDVRKTGYKSFFYRYRMNGQTRRFTIGSADAVTLAGARRRARELKFRVLQGEDPQEEKRRARDASKAEEFTVADLVSRYRASRHFSELRETTAYGYTRQLKTRILPGLGARPVAEVTRADVQELLRQIAEDDGKKTMANRVRACLSAVLAFGVKDDDVPLETNVAADVAPYRAGERGRERYYSEAEIRALWHALDAEEPIAGALLKTLLLLGQRRGETSRMRWVDLSLDHTWTIPAKDAKANRTHVVPLSPQALDVIESIREITGGSPYVFASPVKPDQPIRGELSGPIERIREASGVADFRPHDLRRTVATYMAGSGVDRTTLGKLLNHKGLAGDGVVTAVYDRYARLPEMREAVTKWGERLTEIIGEMEK